MSVMMIALAGLMLLSERGAMAPPDSTGAACPAGPTTATFIQFFECSAEMAKRIVPDARRVRKMNKIKPRHFLIPELRSRLVLAGGGGIDELRMGMGMVRFAGDPKPEMWASSSGDGLIFSSMGIRHGVLFKVCAWTAGGAVDELGTLALRPDEWAALRVEVMGRTLVIAVRSEVVERASSETGFTEEFEARRAAFRRSGAGLPVVDPLVLRPGKLPAEARSCSLEGAQ